MVSRSLLPLMLVALTGCPERDSVADSLDAVASGVRLTVSLTGLEGDACAVTLMSAGAFEGASEAVGGDRLPAIHVDLSACGLDTKRLDLSCESRLALRALGHYANQAVDSWDTLTEDHVLALSGADIEGCDIVTEAASEPVGRPLVTVGMPVLVPVAYDLVAPEVEEPEPVDEPEEEPADAIDDADALSADDVETESAT